MHIAAVLALQSIPFAGVLIATDKSNKDIFAVVYITVLGLTLSAIAVTEGQYALPLMIGMTAGSLP